jgi:hypothetical protein
MYQRPLSELKYIVVHHSATSENISAEDIRKIHIGEGYNDIGYHFLINKQGLHVGRPILFNGAHAITEKYPYYDVSKNVPTMNEIGIGLCIIGNFVNKAPDEHLINETAFAIKRIAEKYKIPITRTRIIPHYAVSYTACPGPSTMQELYKKLKI